MSPNEIFMSLISPPSEKPEPKINSKACQFECFKLRNKKEDKK